MKDENGLRYEECIVGNIIGDHIWGEEKIIRSGTKHFRPGAKVYCMFIYGGMGHEQMRVFGQPRKTSRMIDVGISVKYVTNFRVKKIFAPKVLAFLDKYPLNSNAAVITNWDLDELGRKSAEIRHKLKAGYKLLQEVPE